MNFCHKAGSIIAKSKLIGRERAIMKTKFLAWLITAFLILTLSACDLPEITPPPTEPAATAAPVIDTVPLPSPTEVVEVKPLIQITSTNIQNLTLVNKTAVSNVQGVIWANDSKSLSVISQNSDANGNQVYNVTILDAANLSPLAVYSSSSDRIASVAADGRTVAVISQDMSSFKLIDMGAGNAEIFSLTPGYLIGGITFSPDLRYVAVTKMDAWEVVLFDFVTHEELKTLTGFETAAPVFNAGFTEAAQWLVWHARATIQLQDVESGNMGPSFSHEDFVNDYALTPNGSTLASSYATSIKLWDTASGSQIASFEMGNGISSYSASVSFSPDGRLLAATSGNDLQIWDVASATLLATFSGHSDVVRVTAFSPDQNSIATAGADNQLYLWQIVQ